MKFFPHNFGNIVNQATSASIADTAQYLNNFASIPVSTASIGLDKVGASGTSGVNFTITGNSGSKGITGPTGLKGNGIYLLMYSSGSCGTSGTGGTGGTSGTVCNQVGTGATKQVLEVFPPYTCNQTPDITYYVNTTDGSVINGAVLYSNSVCSTTANLSGNRAVTGGPSDGTIFSTNGAGVITIQGSCPAS